MANVKTVRIRRNLAPNSYYFDLRVCDTLMQEYDVQTDVWKPNVEGRETWRTLLEGTVKKTSVDGTGTVEDVAIATVKWWYRMAGTAEWKDFSTIPAINGYAPIYVIEYNSSVILRQRVNIPAGVVYEVKCIVGVVDTDIQATVTVESDMYRIGCNDKTLDEIRFRLIKGQQNIIYNPEVPAPYTVGGLEKATFLQQCVFDITRGGQKFSSDDVTVEAVDASGNAITEGVELMYDFSRWDRPLYNVDGTIPAAQVDQIGNSVHFVDRYIGVHADTWSIGKGGLFTYAAGERKIDILWKGKIKSIQINLKDGTRGEAPSTDWIKLDTTSRGELRNAVTGDILRAWCDVTSQGDSITEKGLTFTVARNVVITKIWLNGVDATDALHNTENGRYYKGYQITGGDNESRLMVNDFRRSPLQKLDVINGTVTVTMDCGAKYSGVVMLRLKNKDGSVLYDERVISFQRKVPQLEVSVADSTFIESKNGVRPRLLVQLFAEGHEVYNYDFYSMSATTKNTQMYQSSYGAHGIEYVINSTDEGEVTFTPKMIERLDVGIV